MNGAEQEKKSAALNSVFAAALLTTLKIVVGFATGSLGILAEAAHSGLDMLAALVTYLAVRLSSKPADSQHLYGHGKIENLSALFEALLLLLTCAWIFREAIHRLANPVPVEASIWAFLVVAISIFVDITRSRMLMRMARKHKSQALEADALHFTTDIWSSAVVLVGLVGVKIAALFPQLSYLEKADSIAAMIVAVIVIWISMKLGMRTASELLDTAPHDMADQVKAIVESIDDVKNCHAVRVRSAGPEIFIDAHVVLEGNLSLSEAHRLTDKVEEAIKKQIPGADITVHAEPPEEAPSTTS